MKGRWINYSQAEMDFIKANCTLPRRELHQAFCEQFNRADVSCDCIKSICTRKGWSTGRTGRFEKGHIPHPDAHAKGPNATSFKKGNVPANTKPLGTERICAKDGYILVKVDEPNPHRDTPTRYRHKHQVIWEAEHGPIPEGHVVIFKDSNKLNCQLDNLMLVTRAQLLYLNRNGFSDLPDEVKPTLVTIAKLATIAHSAQKQRQKQPGQQQ